MMIEDSLLTNSLNTVIAAFVLTAIFVIIYILFGRKFESKKQRVKFRHRLLYITTIIFLLVLTRIWVEGFTHLFAMLSLVAAGIVVTNKETIMNFVGWLIIDWRGSFSVGDMVYIQNYRGYINKIGPLYFRMYEVVENEYDRATGVSIKLPNSLIITNPVKVISVDASLCLFSILLTVSTDDISDTIANVKVLVKDVIKNKYGEKLIEAKKNLSIGTKQLAKLIDLEPRVEMQEFNGITKIKLKVSFYCSPKDFCSIENQIFYELIAAADKELVKLAE